MTSIALCIRSNDDSGDLLLPFCFSFVCAGGCNIDIIIAI